MAVSMRASVSVASGVAKPTRTRMVCQAAQGEASFAKAQIAAAALAAAALISASPVHAGVVLEQPQLKKVFQSNGTPEPPKERAFRVPGAKAAPAPAGTEAPKAKAASEPLGEFGIDPRVVALPGSIAAIGALGFAISKVDDGFTEWLTSSGAIVRKSDNWAGFEEELKPDSYFWNPTTTPTGTGSKKVVKAPSKGTKSTRK